jgi:hypothetical protein
MSVYVYFHIFGTDLYSTSKTTQTTLLLESAL